jgi:hypothetical protein
MRLDKRTAGYIAIGLGLLIALAPGILPNANTAQIIGRYGGALMLILIGLRFAFLDPMTQRAEDELDETLRNIPYADGTVPDPVGREAVETPVPTEPEAPVRVSETASIAEKMAARAERVRRAKEEGKL